MRAIGTSWGLAMCRRSRNNQCEPGGTAHSIQSTARENPLRRRLKGPWFGCVFGQRQMRAPMLPAQCLCHGLECRGNELNNQ